MTDMTFEAALYARTGQMFDACTRCGKCVDICPITGPAKIDDNVPEGVITGVLDIVRTGDGPEPRRPGLRVAHSPVLFGVGSRHRSAS